MNLVINPTEKCNFRCTFCSSTAIADNKKDEVCLSQIERFLIRYPNTSSIIINGGDPLMMSVEYYWNLLDIIDKLNTNTKVCMVSNLWAFYKNPDKWVDLFNHPNISIMTSFQYGEKRLKGDGSVFTEKDFVKVFNLFLEKTGKRLMFISVIDDENIESSIDTVLLAKRLKTTCRLNPTFGSGPTVNIKGINMGSYNYAIKLSDIYEIYVKIAKLGLTEYEYNTQQVVRRLREANTACPLSDTCSVNIRTINPSGKYYSCPAFAHDKEYSIDFEKEMEGDVENPYKKDELDLKSMKMSCFTCPMYVYCGACRKTIKDHKRLGLVEDHCKKMKQLAPEIIKLNNLEGVLHPTPYVDESEVIKIVNIN
jgi:radical SAM protein with 4Fe4S-binding SPASM domain